MLTNISNKSFLSREIQVINTAINCVTILLHFISVIISICCFFIIVSRWNFNRHHRRRISMISVSPFDDSILLLLFGNTYFILILYSATWISILIHTIAGDFSIFENFLYLGDSSACRVRIAIIFFLTSALFHGYLLQALRCFLKVIFHSTLYKKKLWHLSLNHIHTYVLFILITWIISILILIPAIKIFNVFSYFPKQYHCMISFTNVPGFSYSLVSAYIIPVCFIIYIYSQIIMFIRYAFNLNNIRRARRQIKVVKRILIICCVLMLCGSQTIFFLLQFIITGRVHPSADRIHELGIGISASIITFGFAFMNSFFKFLSMKPAMKRKITITKQ